MHPGDIVAGKYRVANILGRSRGWLLEAHHTEFDQRVAIRMLSPHLCDEKQLEQFRREARTLSKLESEHVARIIDVGTHSDGSFYLVRQFLEGIDLATHIRNQGALRLDEAILYLLQAGEAVQECHTQKIILRELQPSSLFITKKRGGTPLVKLIDFGTAKILKDPAGEVVNGEMTATVMFGMSPYSSPELVRKVRGIDGRTDVWSLGCILYEMLAAVAPFQGEMAELMLRITREEPLPLSGLRPDLPKEFDQIISWALAKDRESRFSSTYAFAHAMKQYASPEGQVLVDQIGRLLHATPDQDKQSDKISPTSPLAKRASGFNMDGESTVVQSFPSSPNMQVDDENPFEKTAFLDDGFRPSDHGMSSPNYSIDGSSPPVAASPSQISRDLGSVPPPRPRQGSWIEPDPMAGGFSGGLASNATGGYPAQTATGAHTQVKQRKMAVVAIGAALVLLPVLVVVLIFALRERAPRNHRFQRSGRGQRCCGQPRCEWQSGGGDQRAAAAGDENAARQQPGSSAGRQRTGRKRQRQDRRGAEAPVQRVVHPSQAQKQLPRSQTRSGSRSCTGVSARSGAQAQAQTQEHFRQRHLGCHRHWRQLRIQRGWRTQGHQVQSAHESSDWAPHRELRSAGQSDANPTGRRQSGPARHRIL